MPPWSYFPLKSTPCADRPCFVRLHAAAGPRLAARQGGCRISDGGRLFVCPSLWQPGAMTMSKAGGRCRNYAVYCQNRDIAYIHSKMKRHVNIEKSNKYFIRPIRKYRRVAKQSPRMYALLHPWCSAVQQLTRDEFQPPKLPLYPPLGGTKAVLRREVNSGRRMQKSLTATY